MAKKQRSKPGLPSSVDNEGGDAQAKFAQDLITRGEAVKKLTKDQKLPPGATHWIDGKDEKGRPKVKRGRVSLLP